MFMASMFRYRIISIFMIMQFAKTYLWSILVLDYLLIELALYHVYLMHYDEDNSYEVATGRLFPQNKKVSKDLSGMCDKLKCASFFWKTTLFTVKTTFMGVKCDWFTMYMKECNIHDQNQRLNTKKSKNIAFLYNEQCSKDENFSQNRTFSAVIYLFFIIF